VRALLARAKEVRETPTRPFARVRAAVQRIRGAARARFARPPSSLSSWRGATQLSYVCDVQSTRLLVRESAECRAFVVQW
jgi:hypothetical protein